MEGRLFSIFVKVSVRELGWVPQSQTSVSLWLVSTRKGIDQTQSNCVNTFQFIDRFFCLTRSNRFTQMSRSER